MSVSAPDGRFNPFGSPDVVRHLALDNAHSIQYLDKTSSKWVTLFRTSPGVSVKKDSVIHVKEKDNNLSVSDVLDDTTSIKRDRTTPRIKTESSPEKSISRLGPEVIDLTLHTEGPVEKRMRLREDGSASPTKKASNIERRTDRSGISDNEMIGYAPAKLSKFPARTVMEMDRRLMWIAREKGSLEARFSTVFSCKFVASSYHNHRNAWEHLKEVGAIMSAGGDDEWHPLYSRALKEMRETSERKQTLGSSGAERGKRQLQSEVL